MKTINFTAPFEQIQDLEKCIKLCRVVLQMSG